MLIVQLMPPIAKLKYRVLIMGQSYLFTQSINLSCSKIYTEKWVCGCKNGNDIHDSRNENNKIFKMTWQKSAYWRMYNGSWILICSRYDLLINKYVLDYTTAIRHRFFVYLTFWIFQSIFHQRFRFPLKKEVTLRSGFSTEHCCTVLIFTDFNDSGMESKLMYNSSNTNLISWASCFETTFLID